MAGHNGASPEPAMVVERRVSEVMTTPVRSVSTTTPLQEAVQLMSEHHVSGLPVLDADGALVGELTEQDLMVRESGFDAGPYVMLLDAVIYLRNPLNWDKEVHQVLGSTVGEVMSKQPHHCSADLSLPELPPSCYMSAAPSACSCSTMPSSRWACSPVAMWCVPWPAPKAGAVVVPAAAAVAEVAAVAVVLPEASRPVAGSHPGSRASACGLGEHQRPDQPWWRLDRPAGPGRLAGGGVAVDRVPAVGCLRCWRCASLTLLQLRSAIGSAVIGGSRRGERSPSRLGERGVLGSQIKRGQGLDPFLHQAVEARQGTIEDLGAEGLAALQRVAAAAVGGAPGPWPPSGCPATARRAG